MNCYTAFLLLKDAGWQSSAPREDGTLVMTRRGHRPIWLEKGELSLETVTKVCGTLGMSEDEAIALGTLLLTDVRNAFQEALDTEET
jgi:hypothetical protein